MITPTTLARAYCANFHDNGCSGIDIGPAGELIRFRDEGCKCLLLDNQRCSYFETAVLPQGANTEWIGAHPKEAAEFAEGAHEYRRTQSGFHGVVPTRKCPDCGKGILPRQRYCLECRNRRRKATNAENQRNWQKKVDHPNTVNENSTLDNQ
jgi:hypothetical protein